MENLDTKVATEQLLVRLENLLTALMHIRSAEGLMDRLSEGGLICSELMELKILEHDDYMVTLSAHAKQNKQDGGVSDYAYYQLFERAAQVCSKRERLLLRPMPSQSVSQAEIDIIKRIAHERNLKDYVVVIRDLFPTDLSVSVDSPAEPNSLKIYTTDWASDFEEQGQRYGHFVSELIAKLKGQQTQLSCAENLAEKSEIKNDDQTVVDASRPDGLYRAEALLIWGGERYEWLTETMMDAIELLVARSPDKVRPPEMENRIGRLPEGGFKKVFKVNRGGRAGKHDVADLIQGRAPEGWYLAK